MGSGVSLILWTQPKLRNIVSNTIWLSNLLRLRVNPAMTNHRVGCVCCFRTVSGRDCYICKMFRPGEAHPGWGVALSDSSRRACSASPVVTGFGLWPEVVVLSHERCPVCVMFCLSFWLISTSQLNVLLRLHFWPIDPMVFGVPSPTYGLETLS